MTWSRWALVVVAAAALLLAGGALAEGKGKKERVPIHVLVTQLSSQGTGVDRDAESLNKALAPKFRYDSLKVLQKRTIELGIDEVGTIDLPNGRAARVQPIHKGEGGVLLAVDVEGAVKTDARVENHKQLVIRAGRYDDGDLILSLEPDY